MRKRKYGFYLFRKQRSQSPTPENATRYSSRLPSACFQFARATANHFLRKNLRNIRSGIMVTTVACRCFPSAKCRSPFLPGKFYRLELGYVMSEFHWQLDNTLFCETIYDDIALFLRLFCHIQKGKRVTTERWFMLKIVQSIFYPMPSGNGNISIDLFLMRLVRWGVMLTMR